MSFIVKNTSFPGLLDLLAPHSCRGCGHLGKPLCDCCKNYIISHHTNICPNCKKPNRNGKCHKCKSLPPTFIVDERSELIGKLIHDFKYDSVRSLAQPLAEILDSILPTISGEVFIVPLPTIGRHVRERGLDHTLLIAKRLAKLRGRYYRVSKALLRSQNSIQVGSNRAQRLSQAQTAYTIKKDTALSPNATYILLDDVWTTGASIQAATKILRQAGAKNIIICLLALSRLN